jgi:hypothetical protein
MVLIRNMLVLILFLWFLLISLPFSFSLQLWLLFYLLDALLFLFESVPSAFFFSLFPLLSY